MPIDAPPTIASVDERLVEQAEQDERCSVLIQKGQLLKQQFPAKLIHTGSVTYSAKYGYILRYTTIESVVTPNGKTAEVYSNVVVFRLDNGMLHTAIDYSQKSNGLE